MKMRELFLRCLFAPPSHKLQPCSLNSYISIHFSPACRRLGVKITSVENKACPVSVLSWGPFCTGNIWSCFWTAHPLNMTPSHSLKHFSTTSEGYERTVILKLCAKKPVTIWKKVKKKRKFFRVPGEGSNTVHHQSKIWTWYPHFPPLYLCPFSSTCALSQTAIQ